MRTGRIYLLSAMILLGISSVTLGQPTFGNADLEGRYAFSMQSSGDVDLSLVTGVLTADGDGNIVEGVMTVDSLRARHTHNFTGQYNIRPNGTGTLTTVSPDPFSGYTFSNGVIQWSLALVSPEKFRLTAHVEFANSFVINLIGEAELQGQVDDELQVRLLELETKVCEAIRLLNTPEGLRSSECCEVPFDFPDGAYTPICGSGSPRVRLRQPLSSHFDKPSTR